MRLLIDIDLSNAAFQDNMRGELHAQLDDLPSLIDWKIVQGEVPYLMGLYDVNGNYVGSMKLEKGDGE